MATIAETKVDILVIGSGPSGIAAALYCLQKGKTIVLLSRKESENEMNSLRIESIHPGVLSLLKTLNINTDLSTIQRGMYHFISDGKNKRSINPYDDNLWDGLHVSKKLFNEHLRKEAKAQNLTILEESVDDLIFHDERIKGVRTLSGKNIYSKYVIDGSGGQRFLGKRMKFHERFYSDSLIAWTGVCSNIESTFYENKIAYFHPNKNGWTWIAKLEDQSFYWTRLSTKDHADISVPVELLSSLSTTKSKVFNTRWRIFRPICTEGGIICGDAAYLIDPATGQGTLNALSSGIKAAQTALSCIENRKNESMILAEYDNWNLTLFEQKVTQLSNYYREAGINITTAESQFFENLKEKYEN